MSPDVDLDRIPHELRRALWGAGFAAELLDPGLAVRPRDDGDLEVLDRHGDVLAVVPLHRVAAVDTERLLVGCAVALDRLGVDVADQAEAALAAGDYEVVDDPAADVVRVHVRLGGARVLPLLAAHRSEVVPGWPAPGA